MPPCLLTVVCGITTIARDHIVELGATLPEIAREKAGIIKPGVPVVCAPQADAVWPVIEETCRQRGAPLRVVSDPPAVNPERSEGSASPASRSTPLSSDLSGLHFRLAPGTSTRPHLRLLGAHQLPNIGVAVGMIEELRGQGRDISEQAVARGLREVRWPGRLQIVARDPIVLLDGAHDGASPRPCAKPGTSCSPAAV